MAKHNKPTGQVNTQTLKKLKQLMTDLSQKHSIKVGILQPQGSEKIPDTDLTLADLAAVHELGATIKNPGGQPYYINSSTGLAVFVKKDSLFGQHLIEKGQVTKPHEINIPARSFLRVPILGSEGKREINKVIKYYVPEYVKDLSKDNQIKLMDKLNHTVAETALLQVQKAFEEDKIKPETKPTSKKKRKYNPSAPTLVDSGQLQRSVSYAIDNKQWGNNG